MSEKVDYSFTANDIPDIIKTKEEIEKLMPEDRPTPTEPVSYTHLTLPTNREV